MNKHNSTKILKIAILPLLAGGALTAMTACKGKSIDNTKTQLNILNYDGGYGKKWLENAANRYMELHKNDSFEEGKKGVEIHITPQKDTPKAGEVKAGKNHLYCFEGLSYNSLLANNELGDITEFITGDNPYETGKTIESKMYDEQKNFFKVDGKYYAIPHYVGSFGIVYNKTVFDDKCFYFCDGYEDEPVGSETRFVTSKTDKKSVGADGIANTFDDGLPVTYDEFYELCNFIEGSNLTPYVHMGKNSENYLTDLMSAIIARYDGAEAYKSNYLMDGTFSAVKINGNDIVYDKNGKPETEMVTVHPDKEGGKYDGYEIQRSASKYYGMSFIHKLVEKEYVNDPNTCWQYDKISGSYLHTDAQRNFIKSQFSILPSNIERRTNQPIAMILEGNWWASEASNVFDSLTDAQKAQTNYGWMPLPTDPTSTNTKQTTLNSLTSYMFLKAGLTGATRQVAGDFLQYLNTDSAYKEFTTITSAIKSFKYELTADEKKSLSTFGQSFWDYFQASDKIFPESRNEQFVKALSDQQLSRRYWKGDTMSWPSKEFEKDITLTPGKYLSSMYNYYKNYVWVF